MKTFNSEITYFVSKTCSPDWNLGESVLAFFDLTFVMGGEAYYTINDEVITVKAGQAVFIPRLAKRCACTSKTHPMQCIAINFVTDSDILRSMSSGKLSFGGQERLLSYLKQLEHSWLNQETYRTLRVNAIFDLLLAEVIECSHDGEMDNRVEQMKQYIVEHLSERITVQHMAEMFGINAVYCGNLFKQGAGDTILGYANRVRIQKAADLLLLGDISVTAVAQQVGMEDLYYFSKLFKRIKGVAPSCFKRATS